MRNGRIVDTGSPRDITDRYAKRTTVSFKPHCDHDRSALARLAGVERVEEDADRLTVYGTSTMIAAVCASAVDDGTGHTADLRVQHPTLDDALVNLIGSER